MNPIMRHAVGVASLLLAASSFATGSLVVSRELTVDRPPATVWKLMGEFNALDVWLPLVLGSSVTGPATKPGAIRLLDLGDNTSVTEELLSYNGTRHSYSYAFVKSPLPVKNYVSTIKLMPTPDGRTLIKWCSSFDADGAPDDKAKEAIGRIYDAGLAKVATIFRKQASP